MRAPAKKAPAQLFNGASPEACGLSSDKAGEIRRIEEGAPGPVRRSDCPEETYLLRSGIRALSLGSRMKRPPQARTPTMTPGSHPSPRRNVVAMAPPI